MKITGFRVEQYLMKMDRPVGDANLPSGVEMLPGSILWLDTDEGISGLSLGYGGGIESLFGVIEGADPREVVALWIRMNDFLHKAGNEGAACAALSAIDMALWDLKARLAGEPLWKTLGASTGRVKAYASGLDYCLSDDELFAFYRRMAEQGIDSGKLKVGLDVQADLRRLGIVREALSIASPRPGLMIDANEYWSPKQAVRYVRQLEKHFDLLWVEEPARRWDYHGLKLVKSQLKAAVATGENLHNLADVYPLIANQAVDVINVWTGQSGVTGLMQIAHMAHVHGVQVSMMNAQANYMAQVAAALPNHNMMEVVDPGREHCLEWNHRVENGHIVLSDAPGFGIEIDEGKLRALQKNPPTGKGKFPFPRREGAGRYLVPPAPGEVPWR
jgi:L-alanine-DL-glutamate epimerase-like enolase superfamily enzyme